MIARAAIRRVPNGPRGSFDQQAGLGNRLTARAIYRPMGMALEVKVRSIRPFGARGDSATSSIVRHGRSAMGRRSDGTGLIAGSGAGRAMLASTGPVSGRL